MIPGTKRAAHLLFMCTKVTKSAQGFQVKNSEEHKGNASVPGGNKTLT
jgi:hypothetical protein